MTESQFNQLAAEGYNRIPLVLETFADLDTPLSVYLKLANKPYTYLLESVVAGERFGRVLPGLERDGVEEDVAADAIAEQPLHLRQIVRHRQADALAVGVHEVHDHLLVAVHLDDLPDAPVRRFRQ